ncbi:uncharacterized protein K452DRAFT_249755 [Aplosporella prunicola CBS 121167]|uniref:Septin-type G domain-containing protein n=1 Tax=Aplosporella prunicola CBS 121167 TaxID=1176127 RepID=A0A6A6BCX9_9PEZI|nr:uncharacterized protein K452DRAFT_249755 [Aplosporella prunicola CBS 121167]KAF2142000.1 hypothetical protein K452DRAFT_249755 [Aplosporella prunicola CBS 121167]
MRPNMGGDAHQQAPRPRKSGDVPSSSSATPSHAAGPTTFFLRSEDEVHQTMSKSPSRDSAKESVYGVQSLEDALDSAFGDKDPGAQELAFDKTDKGDKDRASGSSRSKRRAEEAMKWSNEVEQRQRELADLTSKQHACNLSESFMTTTSSHPLTPVQFALSPNPASDLPSTPKSVSLKSFRLSDEDDEAASQAIFSGGEEDEEGDGLKEEDSSIPQLVMPSIQMPTRRPFTEKGKNMGKLKVLIAGETGVGKTSLIRSIVQLCEDIVHVDPLTFSPPIIQPPEPAKSRSKRRKQRSSTTKSISEVYASTKAYPSWWSDMEESRVLRRRKSIGDTVLERNLCFVDTPGLEAGKQPQEQTDPIVQYVESLLHRNASMTAMSDGDLLGILSGNGGVQVDVVFFLVRLSDEAELNRNIEHIRRLSSLTNVIPLVCHSDTHDAERISSYKMALLRHLDASSIRPFLFGKSIEDALIAAQPAARQDASQQTLSGDSPKPTSPGPFAITSASAADSEIMDASLLMSPDYIQPLVPSELAVLVEQVFTPDTIAWLRHSAIKKFLRWRGERIMEESMTMHSTAEGCASDFGGSTSGFETAATRAQNPFSAPYISGTTGASSIFSSPSPSQVLIPRPGTSSTSFSLPLSASHFSAVSSPSSPQTSQYYTTSTAAATTAPLAPHNYNLARLADHTQREERLAQVRLARWAADLQRSLANERRRFEELERGKRARWLLEQIGAEAGEGRISEAASAAAAGIPAHADVDWALTRRADVEECVKREARWTGTGAGAGELRRANAKARLLDPRDPLGLCEWGDEVRRSGWVVVQVLGGAGVVGAVLVAVWRAWGQGGGGAGLVTAGGGGGGGGAGGWSWGLGAWFGEGAGTAVVGGGSA